MKNLFLLLTISIISINCKAQTIYPLEGPYSTIEDPKPPIYTKDINNIRNSFIGVWKAKQGTKEFTMYLYKLDKVPNGLYGPQGLQFKDGIMGCYIYKENGIVKINSKKWLLNPHVPNKKQYGPFFGFTKDGLTITNARFIDYGIKGKNSDGSISEGKRADAELKITNSTQPLKMSLKLINNFEGIVIHTSGKIEPDNYNFSIPTNLILTKISNIPPPL
ncbi:DUF6705 family protein [uncultured Tenacibaculum sp.]|uniref:DUF6705 family protein n=1 Tax=uncultured Tenacibaculum sp. TaxID=174713 RepID=UPI0026327502|nr:DUF6705 family protein [uncultured Tenacibaculum sp.]